MGRQSETSVVAEGVWTFEKDRASLSLERHGQGDEVVLVVRQPEGARELPFENLEALEQFQDTMETFLLRTGWTLASFSPERRTALDRRTFPRITNDRRPLVDRRRSRVGATRLCRVASGFSVPAGADVQIAGQPIAKSSVRLERSLTLHSNTSGFPIFERQCPVTEVQTREFGRRRDNSWRLERDRIDESNPRS